MPVVRIQKHSFSALSKLASREKGGLADILRTMLNDNARAKLYAASISAITDNTAGTPSVAPPTVSALPIPAMSALSGSNGAQATAFGTSMGKVKNATAVMVAALNAVRTYMQLPRLNYSEGTVAAAYTVPSLDNSVTAASTANAVDYNSAVAAMGAVAQNLKSLTFAMNDTLKALGERKIVETLGVSSSTYTVLLVIPAVGNAATSQQSMLATDVGNWFASVRNVFATLAQAWNTMIVADEYSLTDNTGGTAAGALATETLPTPAAGAATTSAPKAGFDTQMAVLTNSFASLTKLFNEMAYTTGGAVQPLQDYSGGVASATLAAVSSSLTAVDGSSGTSAVDQVSALSDMQIAENNLSTLGAAITKLQNALDISTLGADALGGTVGNQIAGVPPTATGVGGAGNVTLLNTAVNTWLGTTKNNIGTLAAALNACATELGLRPLSVIAG